MPRLAFLLVFALFTLGLQAADTVYRCPMHPWIHADHAGEKCTICGMALVASDTTASPAGVVILDSSVITTIGVETSTVARQPLTRTLRVNGRIDDDDTRHRIVAARVPGRIEQLHINYVGAEVAAGAPLITLFSPDVLTAQRVFVERLRASDAIAGTELAAARERLFELGLTAADVAALEISLKPSATITVRAPYDGTVVAKSVYEGQYVAASDRLLELADFSRMWFVFDAYEQDIPWLHIGQQIEVTTRAVPGEVIRVPIAFIDPNFDEMTHTTKVRAVLPNPHYGTAGAPHRLPHRVLAEGRVLVESPAVLAAPRAAILDRGNGPLAYVDRGNGHYEQRTVTLGRRGDGLVEILSGLNEGDHVVTHAALLIDAQAQLANEATDHAAAPAPATTSAPSPDFQFPIFNALASASVSAAAVLAADDYAAYQKLFPSLIAAADTFPSLPVLALGSDLKSARRSFEPWSTAAADLLKPHRARLGLKIFQCPMSPVLGQGRWVQRGEPLKNPFFGSAMSDCGAEVP
jgi:Cu(I)/Ag(I) efflux system membrane fusion protein